MSSRVRVRTLRAGRAYVHVLTRTHVRTRTYERIRGVWLSPVCAALCVIARRAHATPDQIRSLTVQCGFPESHISVTHRKLTTGFDFGGIREKLAKSELTSR